MPWRPTHCIDLISDLWSFSMFSPVNRSLLFAYNLFYVLGKIVITGEGKADKLQLPINVPKHFWFISPFLKAVTTSWSWDVMDLWCHGPEMSWTCDVMVLWCHGPEMSWSWDVMVLRCHGPVMSWTWDVMDLWCHGPVMSWSWDVMDLRCFLAVLDQLTRREPKAKSFSYLHCGSLLAKYLTFHTWCFLLYTHMHLVCRNVSCILKYEYQDFYCLVESME